ncbi:Cof-type HAD-IIB family hydrolase [Salinibacillus xinjiangensis]|uniref:Cof-type HAD-IIB family hydrolase n=1 Tax=Salinibacillus xinjiangensis TaxID=1229268 RepID=A0A6G1X774_9BACI|nr:Cof-type HAD-IIB family hydrolase [Salinibacillus xinjiangensis]MRG86779.1 Cof-type HAD-IIB family hydrolase [Salinibacillus xinjiangensis]
MMNGIVFFDLDGTLLNATSDVDPDVIAVIEELKENGYEPVIATGRSVVEVEEVLEKTGIHSIISMNGQHGIFNGETLYQNKISIDILERLREMVMSRGEEIAFYNVNQIRVTGHNDIVQKAYEKIHSPVPPIDGDMLDKTNVNMALVLADTGDEEYKQAFPELSFIRNSPFSMDVIPKQGSKASGIKTFLEILQIKDIPTFAFGDGNNDMEMFELVDYGIAMGNAVEGLKEIASFVTDTNTNGGISKGLKYYNII